MNANQITTANATLTASGWKFVGTVMGGDKSNEEKTGFMYKKDGFAFYLNEKTCNNLPA